MESRGSISVSPVRTEGMCRLYVVCRCGGGYLILMPRRTRFMNTIIYTDKFLFLDEDQCVCSGRHSPLRVEREIVGPDEIVDIHRIMVANELGIELEDLGQDHESTDLHVLTMHVGTVVNSVIILAMSCGGDVASKEDPLALSFRVVTAHEFGCR